MVKLAAALYLLLLIPFVCAYDLSLDVAIGDQLSIGSTIENLFKITNHDHQTGKKENLTVSVNYSILHLKANSSTPNNSSFNNNISIHDNFTVHGLNSWKTSGTGSWTPTEVGTYRIEGWIVNSEENNDTSLENNLAEKNVTVHSTSNLTCDWMVSINPKKTNYAIIEKTSWRINVSCANCTGLPENLLMSYWVEDENGVIVKEKRNWSKSSILKEKISTPRTWTPDEQGAYSLHAAIEDATCKDSDNSNNKATTNINVSFSSINESCQLNLTLYTDVIYENNHYNITISSNTTHHHNILVKSWVEDFYTNMIVEKEETLYISNETQTIKTYFKPPNLKGANPYLLTTNITQVGCKTEQNLIQQQVIVVVGQRPKTTSQKKKLKN